MEDSEGLPAVERVISRTKDSMTQVTMTLPGGPQVRYNYTGSDLTSVTDLSTSRTWQYTYDTKHNLLTVRSPLEASGNPLVQYDYLFDSNGLIDQVTAKYRQDDGSLGDPVETQFNDLNLPTQVKAYARAGSGNVDQITQFQYDGGTLTVGNLTKITEAFGQPQQQATTLAYPSPNGAYGLPGSATNEVLATSSLTYDNTTGRLLTASSPQNLVVGTNHPDRLESTTTLQYTTDGLPSLVQDPLGHQVGISYNASATNTANLVITTTYNDSTTRTVTLDPMGRVLEAVDERGVKTQWTYNPQGAVKTITRAAGSADQRVTTLSYDDRGDLRWFDPPGGSSGRVSFEYNRYTSSGTLVTPTVYEGQVTRINYADGRSEYFGYNDAGELAWKRKSSGHVITIASRDSQHRVTQISFPAAGGGGAFNVSTVYDEFGRVKSTTDNTGTTNLAYDVLNRVTQVAPPSPQKTLDFSYSPDTVLQRWTTSVTLAGVGTYQYKEDTKGRLYQVQNAFNQVFQQEYDRDGKPTVTTWPNGVTATRT
jgi:YD repeat-containing protein